MTINLRAEIKTTISRFPITYTKNGEQKQFYPIQTIFTMTDGSELWANSYLASDISALIMGNANILRGRDTVTIQISRIGKMSDTRYNVEIAE